ncbi:penicillin-binding protein 2 [Acidithrix sp. C25]|uniref:penicillin-binding protein 2 n=1 Tax=Acidithrix sp. C25 TaxID=1671482 RepID=UPI00191BBF8D|nr:penicillin-binding protein 2 [Acidithrix sp. C25]
MSFFDSEEPGRGSLSDRRRIRAVGFAVFALFVALIARLYTLQVLQVSTYRSLATQNQVRSVVTSPPRGLIVDRNQNLLVGNQVVESLTVDQTIVTKSPWVLKNIATELGVPLANIQAAYNSPQQSPYAPVSVAYNVTKAQIIYIKEHPSLFPGVSSSLGTQRVYPEGTTASQVLGYVRQISASQLAQYAAAGYQAGDQIGQAGIEASYEKYLRGVPGKKTLQVNFAGKVVGTLANTPPKPGDNVVLNMDLNLQKAVESALSSQIAKLSHTYDPYRHQYFTNLSGAAVVENVNTGAIVAMASYPTYNPSVWVGNISQAAYNKITLPQYGDPTFNRAIAGEYTPGSTFKLATASAALSSGLISPYYYYNDTGIFNIPNCKVGSGLCSFHNSGFEHLGSINVTTALTASDDIFFYNLGYMFYANTQTYGTSPIQNMAAKYGWGSPTGVDLPGEASGLVDSPALRALLHKKYPKAYPYSSWYTADQLEMAFGQGETVITPIQMANAYATFANGGTRYVPQMVAGIVNQNGKVVKTFAPKVAAKVPLSAVDRAAMSAGFAGVISNPLGTAYGTFSGFPLSSYPLAGKTGTASVTGLEPNAWFVAYGPLPKPQYVVTVVVDHGGFGTSGAAPVVRTIFNYLRTHTIPPVTFGQPHIPAGATTYARYGIKTTPTATTSTTGVGGASKTGGSATAPATTTTTKKG